MAKKIVRKVLLMLPVLFLVSIILFTLMEVLPGDAAYGLGSDVSDEYIQQFREEHGLDKPAYVRYLDWVTNMLKGDFGVSLISELPIIDRIKVRFPVTLELTLLSMIVAVVIAIPAGILSAVKRNTLTDYLTSVLAMVGVTIPPFWLGNADGPCCSPSL